jgi:ATPase family associated with various cellular activities (AAA)
MTQTTNNTMEIDADTILRGHYVLMSKVSGRALNHDQATRQIDALVAGVATAGRASRGWSVVWDKYTHGKFTERPTGNGNEMKTTVRLIVESKTVRPNVEFDNMVTALDAKGTLSKWSVVEVDGQGWEPSQTESLGTEAELSQEQVGYASCQIPEDFADKFSELFGLDSHISRLRRALELAVKSGFSKRVHTMLQGPPACGKTHICNIVSDILGSEAVLQIDGPSATMAGVQKMLGERDIMPRVLIIEEIEKVASAEALTYLLSIMDMRGEIRKVTARGNIIRDARMITICTVNDYEKFKAMQSGALASRFANRVFFKRPDRETRYKILKREVDSIGGNEAWIEPTLDYGEQMGIDDPRDLIAICLCGQDDLLNGRYQRELAATAERES